VRKARVETPGMGWVWGRRVYGKGVELKGERRGRRRWGR
jgi:hypothetical protein